MAVWSKIARLWPVLFVALVLASWNTYTPGDSNDDTSYIALARALARGLGYVSLAEAGAGAHQRFPPGFPMLMAPLQWLAPENYALLRLQVAAFSVLAALLLFRYNQRLGLWRWIPLLTLFNPFWLFSCTQVMSEQPFLAGLLAYFFALDHSLRNESPRNSRWFYLGMGLGLLCALRSIAIVLIPVVAFLLLRQPRRVLLLGAGVALTAGPWLLRSILTGYDNEYAVTRDVWQTLLQNLTYFPTWAGWLLLTGPRWVPPWLPLWVGLLPFGLSVWGLWKLRRPLLLGWVVMGLALLLVWPYQHPRLLLPFLPFLQMGLWHQLGVGHRPLVRCLFGILLAGNLVWSVCDGVTAIPRHKDAGAVAMIRALPAGSVTSTRDQSWWLWTGSPVSMVQQLQSLEREWRWLDSLLSNGVRLIVVEDLASPDSQALLRSWSRRGWLYRQVYASPEALVFAFQPDAGWRASARWQALARTALQMKKPEWAVPLFQKALRSAPYDISAASGLAYALASQGQTQQAAQLVRSILSNDPDCGEALMVQGFLEHR